MKILFLCAANVFRSQMAEAFFNTLTKKHEARSAALIMPQDRIPEFIIKAMAEEGIDVSNNKSKKINKDLVQQADIVILMHENLKKDFEPYKFNLKNGAEVKMWSIRDIIVSNKDNGRYPEFIKARNLIKEKVINLLNSLD